MRMLRFKELLLRLVNLCLSGVCGLQSHYTPCISTRNYVYGCNDDM